MEGKTTYSYEGKRLREIRFSARWEKFGKICKTKPEIRQETCWVILASERP